MTSWKISFSFALVTIACSGSGFLTSCLAHPSVDNGNQEFTKDLFSSKYLVNAGNKVYYVETSLALSWVDAVAFCKSYKMELASIQSVNENTILRSHLINNNLLYSLYWTGGNDLAKTGEFVWQSTGQKFVFTDWSPGNPSHMEANGTVQHCVEVYYDVSLQWDDGFCETPNHFICEF